MGNKIESLELEAFRAYKDKQKLDFRVGQEIANLVVIYAPNGSGKTTIYDSLEWAMTGTISRISDNNHVNEIAQKNKGKILKNIDSDLENGSVKIVLSNQDTLEVKTKKLDGRQKTDYSKGETRASGVFLSENKRANFVEKNILKNHQIDKFLRFQNSVERYQALSIFWDAENESEKYVALLNVLNEIKKMDKKLSIDILKMKKDIEKLSLPATIKEKLRNNIIIYNEKEKKDILEFEKDYNHTYSQAAKYKAEKEFLYKSINEENQIKIAFYEDYKLNFENKSNKYIQLINNEIPKKQNILFNYKKQKKYHQEIKKIEKEISLININISEINFLNSNKDFIIQTSKEVNLKNLECEKLQNQVIELNGLIANVHEKNAENETELQETRNIIKEKENILKVINIAKEKSELISKINKQLIHIDTIYEEKIKLDFEVNELNSLKNYLGEIVSSDIKNFFVSAPEEFIRQNFSNLYEEIYSYQNTLIGIEKEITQTEEEIRKNIQMSSDLEKIKKMTLELIKINKAGSCPVCASNFNDYKNLVNRIQSTIPDISNLENLDKKLYEAKREYDLTDSKMLKSYINLIEESKVKLGFIKKELNDKETILAEKLNEIHELKQLSNDLEKCKVDMKYMLIEIGFSVNTDIKDILTELNNLDNKINTEVKLFKNRQESLLKLLNESKNIIGKYNTEINIVITKIEIVRQSIRALENNEIFVEYIKIKEKNKYREISLNDIQKKKQELEEKFINLMTQINFIDEDLKGISDEEIIQTELNEFIVEKNRLGEEIASYQKKCKVYFNEEQLNDEIFNRVLEKSNHKIVYLKNQIEILLYVITTFSSYLDNEFLKSKQAELEFLEKNSEIIKIKLNNLEEIKRDAYHYLKCKISEIFNEDSINEIFKMIDPLPSNSKISFELDELKEGMLGMDVLLEDELYLDAKPPILYLSSAQVNILSLSIFLASAIENISFIKTILMDDPLQHLDGLNILSFIDLVRIIAFSLDIQLIISTHNQTFFDLCKRKIDPKFYNAKYIDLTPTFKTKLTNNVSQTGIN